MAHPWTRRATRNGGSNLGVAEQIAGADDHDPLLAERADEDRDALPAQLRRFGAMHRCCVRKSTQIGQQAQGQNRAHRLRLSSPAIMFAHYAAPCRKTLGRMLIHPLGELRRAHQA